MPNGRLAVMIDKDNIIEKLKEVKDPELPLVSVIDMGIITGIDLDEKGNVKVVMTPTFAGCPAIEYMKAEIKKKLDELEINSVEVEVNFNVQWNSNMISENGRKLLKDSGFALPARHTGLVQIEMLQKIECPFCGKKNTRLMSAFGATQCRAVHYCDDCMQMFEQIKPV